MPFFVAQFTPDEEHPHTYTVTFPDLAGCISQGESLEDAFCMAQEALECHLGGMLADGDTIPNASSMSVAKAKALAEAKEDGDTLPDGTIFQLIPVPHIALSPVRINISLAPQVLAMVDSMAKAEGMSRSGFLATAARHYVQQLRV